jgi:hypothetical protein
MNTMLRAAIEARTPRAIAELLLEYRTGAHRIRAVLEVLEDCSAGEVRRIHLWAQDWLSEPDHQVLRARNDAQWQAVNAVYELSKHALQQYGVVRPVEDRP